MRDWPAEPSRAWLWARLCVLYAYGLLWPTVGQQREIRALRAALYAGPHDRRKRGRDAA